MFNTKHTIIQWNQQTNSPITNRAEFVRYLTLGVVLNASDVSDETRDVGLKMEKSAQGQAPLH